MKPVIVILAILAAASGFDKPGLRVKFDMGLHPGIDFFFDLPRREVDAVAMQWSALKRPPSALSTLKMYCPPRPVICCLYDPETRYIKGVQVALPEKDFSGAVFSWEEQGFIPWKVSSDTYMTKQLYFISEETLSNNKKLRVKAAETNITLQENSVWVVGFNQQIMEIPTNSAGIQKTGFTKQGFIPWMGQHYYYNMTTESLCTAKDIFNWFPLCHGDKLIGMGFLSAGSVREWPGEKFYFERPSRTAVQIIVPHGPKCFYELADNPTFTTMHIYFIDEPWKIVV